MERTSHFPGMLLVIFEEPFAKESRQHYLFSKYAIVPDYCDGQVSNLFFKGYLTVANPDVKERGRPHSFKANFLFFFISDIHVHKILVAFLFSLP